MSSLRRFSMLDPASELPLSVSWAPFGSRRVTASTFPRPQGRDTSAHGSTVAASTEVSPVDYRRASPTGSADDVEVAC